MKLIKSQQLVPMLQNLMESYNAFTTVESLVRKSEAWFEKLQYQNIDILRNAMQKWDGSKMPTAVDILKKCFEMHVSNKNDNNHKETCNFVCEYNKFFQSEEECEFFKTDKYRNDFEIIVIFGFRDYEDEKKFLVCINHSCDIRLKLYNEEHFRYYVYGFIPT